ncbi:AMP-binding protein [Limnohabitans sp. 103DPR2]|uniref:AMP-binding protein n=1 Tax=Limnohabitans sp. 103DPR2 TaxID=1678129 RepID=UPI0006DC7695|nr:AMP-binding protein [Limnohabitans sp. 103DPR2]ALK91883.1 Long-chain-fatty-acid--CoA ligase FadD15 [Limnohabitans sp. 103DPR2]
MSHSSLILDHVYGHEKTRPELVYMTQPIGQGQVIDYTWRETLRQARSMAAYLKAQNLAPGARVAILSKNCAHFIMAELAIWMAGGTTVAIFPTESGETIRYVLDHSEASFLFVGKLDTWPLQAPFVPNSIPCIAFPLAPENHYTKWDDVVRQTPPLEGDIARAPTDLAMIMYTSGSTGQPKGVMHNFERISAATEGIVKTLKETLGDREDNRILSYLPLAHVFERAWVGASSLVHGKTHVFFAESLDSFIQDLNRAKPTMFISVPRLWLKFQQGVFSKMPPAKLNLLLSLPIIGGLVRKKILKGLGLDQVIVAGSGSAPIPAELIVWYRKLGLNLLEGYAMTEDFAYSHNSTEAINAPGCVGVPLEGVQARISEEGEILVKSPGQMVGYYKRPDLDAEAFTADGFFKTGDQGQQRADGLLKITGRVKELFKTSKGKYVAPAPIENKLNVHPMIEMSIVSGVSQPSAYAMVVLSEDIRPKMHEPEVKAQVESELTTLLAQVNSELADYEKLRMLVIANEAWSIENGFLTPTMKIKRSRIEASVESQVASWYEKSGSVFWA